MNITINFQFAYFIEGILGIATRGRGLSSVVVEDDVPPIIRTADVNRIRNGGSSVLEVFNT